MEKNWVKIYSCTTQFNAEMLKGLLAENDIDCVLINKRDSSYGTFGEIELYTHRDEAMKALHVIKSTEK